MNAGIYLHVPFCAQKCPYCDFYSRAYRKSTAEAWFQAMLRNIRALPEHLPVDSVYFGGGTPSLIPPAQIASMLNAVRMRCDVADDTEVTLEANPRTVTGERLLAWKHAGVNRLSVGVQSFRDDILQTLGRTHTAQQAKDALLRASDAGFSNLSLDLMLGLPAQTASVWAEELQTAVSMPVTHISAYLLKIEENTPFGANPPALSDSDEAADRWLQMHDMLTGAGFHHYEISNFAKPGCESRHNNKYWLCAPYYGIGPGAHSCHDGIRTAVPRDLDTFCSGNLQTETVTDCHPLTDGERIMLGLRLADGIAPADYPDAAEKLMAAAKPLIPQYLRTENGRLRMTPEGWLVSNAVLAQLLRNIE